MDPNGNRRVEAAFGQLAQAMAQGRYPWWYPQAARDKAIDYFVYGTDFTPLAASATTPNPINISGDSAFVILAGTLVETATDNVTLLTLAPLLFRLQDTGSGRYLSNIAIHASNWFGSAEQPLFWAVPKILTPNSTFVVEAQNLEATARNVRVAFHGFKIFSFQP